MNQKEPYGVGGWLALLVVGLTILGPLLSFGMTSGEISSTERDYPELIGNDLWEQIKAITWTALGIQVVITFTAGFRLTNAFRPSSVRFAIFALWFSGVGITVITFVLMANLSGFDSAAVEAELARGVVQGTITAGIWTAYLLLSKRVKNTYYTGQSEIPGATSGEPETRMSLGDRWRGQTLARRKAIFFTLCWVAFVVFWATVFDEDTTDFFQDRWEVDWGKVTTWAIMPPAIYFLLRWAYAKFVIAGSDKDPA